MATIKARDQAGNAQTTKATLTLKSRCSLAAGPVRGDGRLQSLKAHGRFGQIASELWGRQDLNLRRLSRRFYRPLPLTTRALPLLGHRNFRGGAPRDLQRRSS